MGRIVRIPVRSEAPRVQSAVANETGSEAAHTTRPPATYYEPKAPRPAEAQPVMEEQLVPTVEPVTGVVPSEQGGGTDWQNLALRLQAEMDNYRKRQQRLAQDQIEAERQRLLRGMLQIVDDLERALAAPAGDVRGLREGVQLTRRAALQRLQQEGVERIEAQSQPFDPNLHEAVSAIPHDGRGVAPGTVIQVLEPGYRLGVRLLRPARVVVAV
jgi:molecular chaperone GrpE